MSAAFPMKSKPAYIVVEKSGMVGEQDVGKFGTHHAALAFIDRAYSTRERDKDSPHCLYPDVCLEQDGSRTYDI